MAFQGPVFRNSPKSVVAVTRSDLMSRVHVGTIFYYPDVCETLIPPSSQDDCFSALLQWPTSFRLLLQPTSVQCWLFFANGIE